MENFGKFICILIMMFFSAIIAGSVFMKLWEWFVVETFHVIQISLIQSIGLMLIVGYLRKSNPKKDDEELNFIAKLSLKFLEDIIVAAFTLGIGYFITLFM